MPKVKKSEYESEYDFPLCARYDEIRDDFDREDEPFCFGTEWTDVYSALYLKVIQ